MTVRHLLPIVLVDEAPPRGGPSPLGPFDCDSGLRLAQLDPANHDEWHVFTNTSATPRRCLERTLGLFDRVNLLAEHPGQSGKGDAWPKEQAAEAWRALAPSLAGRRVALAGRVAEAAGLKGLLPLRWLRMGGEGEPAEACYLPHPSGVNRWYNDGANRAAVGTWLAQVRRERQDADAAWVAIGGGWAYHLARGEWGRTCGREVDWYAFRKVLDHERIEIRDRLLIAAGGIHRFGGFGALTVLDHLLLVASLCPTPGGKRLGLAHDPHETPLVGDASSPLKRIIRREWRPVEEVAARAVERLLGLDPTPEEREEVRRADRLALLVEARQVGVDLGDPDEEFGSCRAAFARLHARPYSRADWFAAWDAAAR